MRPVKESSTRDGVCIRNGTHRQQYDLPGLIHTGGSYSAKTALYLAASLTEGATRDASLKAADTRDRHTSRSGKERKVTNIRILAENAANPDLCEVGPKIIVKIYLA